MSSLEDNLFEELIIEVHLETWIDDVIKFINFSLMKINEPNELDKLLGLAAHFIWD